MNAVQRTWVLGGLLAGCIGCVEIPEPAMTDARSPLEPDDAGETRADVGRSDGRRPLPPIDMTVVDGPPLAPIDARPPFDRSLPDADLEEDAGDVGFADFVCPEGGIAVPALRLCVRFDACPALPEARVGHRMVVLDGGWVLLAGGGGQLPVGSGLNEWTYAFDGLAWDRAGGLGDGGRHRHTLDALPGDRAILVSGDQGPGEPVDNLQSETFVFYGPMAQADRMGWRSDDSVSERRARHAAAWLGDRLLISGGLTSGNIDSGNIGEAAAWTIDGGWRGEDTGEPPLFDHRIVEAGGRFLLVGGIVVGQNDQDGPRLNDVVFAWEGDQWVPSAEEVTHGGGPIVGTASGALLVGGPLRRRGPELRRIGDGAAVDVGQMAVVRDGATAARVGDGTVVAILGGELAGAQQSTVDLVDVSTGEQAAVRIADGTIGRWTEAQAVTLPDGSALVVGGLADGVPTSRCLRISLSR